MATINFTQKGNFILGRVQMYAIIQCALTYNAKLVEYNFPFVDGIDYEDNGEGEVIISLKGLLLNYQTIGDIAISDLDALRTEFKEQKLKKYIKFSYPRIGAFNVKIKKIEFVESGEKEGYEFNIDLVKVSVIEEKEKTQTIIEKTFESTPQQSEGTFTVVSGDTLWGKSIEFYGEGRLWRKIWEYSDNIAVSKSKNPNLIYPGEVFKYPIV